jgi:hypothetical protein
MKRVARYLLLAVVASTTLIAVPAAAQTPAPASAANATAFEAIGGCFAAQKRVLLAFVIDESASLGDSATGKAGNDPTGRRVLGMRVGTTRSRKVVPRQRSHDVPHASIDSAIARRARPRGRPDRSSALEL